MTLIINLEFNCINNHHQCFGSVVKLMGKYQSMHYIKYTSKCLDHPQNDLQFIALSMISAGLNSFIYLICNLSVYVSLNSNYTMIFKVSIISFFDKYNNVNFMCIIIWFTLIVGNNQKFGSIITEHLILYRENPAFELFTCKCGCGTLTN